MKCSVKFKILSANEDVIALKEKIKEILVSKNVLVNEILIDLQVFFNQDRPFVEANPLMIIKLTWVHDYNIFSELNLMDIDSMKDIPDYELEDLCQEFSEMVGNIGGSDSDDESESAKEEDSYKSKAKKKKGLFSIFKKKEEENPFL